MINGKTSAGFEFSFDETRLDDMRFVDVLAVVVDPAAPEFDRIAGASKLTEMLLGKELKAQLYQFIGAQHDGRVPRAELEQALTEIMAAGGKDAEKN